MWPPPCTSYTLSSPAVLGLTWNSVSINRIILSHKTKSTTTLTCESTHWVVSNNCNDCFKSVPWMLFDLRVNIDFVSDFPDNCLFVQIRSFLKLVTRQIFYTVWGWNIFKTTHQKYFLNVFYLFQARKKQLAVAAASQGSMWGCAQ